MDLRLHDQGAKTKSPGYVKAVNVPHLPNKQGNYPIFYGIEPILAQAFHGPSLGSLTVEVLLDRLLLQLRLTTLMRSVDLSNIVWALFQQDNQFFIRTSDKNGVALVFSVAGHTLSTLALYIHKHLHLPAPFLLRHLTKPSHCLGSERIFFKKGRR